MSGGCYLYTGIEIREEAVESVGERMVGVWPNLVISQLGERGMETGFSLP